MKTDAEERRKNIRFKPDPLMYALIDTKTEQDQDSFNPQIVGLIVNESYGGCELAILREYPVKKGDKVKVKSGESGVIKAKISWQKKLDDKIGRIGLRYL